MDLRNEIKFTNCKIVQIDKYPKSPEPSRVLVITLPLVPTVADVLKCRDMCFDINDNPRKFDGGFGLEHQLTDCEIKLPTSNGALVPLSPKIVQKFRIGHDAKDNLTLTFRVHFAGYGAALEEWSDDINDKIFDVSILSLQGELFPDEADSKVDGPAGGTRVDMSSELDDMVANLARAEHGPVSDDELLNEFGPEDGPCTSCNARIPMESPGRHVTGHACARTAGSPLAAAAVSGGTHQKKRGRPRKDGATPAPTADERASLDAEISEHLDLTEEGVTEDELVN